MTERKKPGPKPKCKECGRKEGEGHYDDCSVGMGVVGPVVSDLDKYVAEHRADMVTAAEIICGIESDHERNRAQAYAMRVWNGQSPDVPRKERIARCIRALEGQNLPTQGVEYPQ